MLRTPNLVAHQHHLFLSLERTDPSCKNFLSACEQLENDQIIEARDMRSEFAGLTLLHETARLGYQVAVQHLISIGHNINPIDSSVSRMTPLLEAIASGQLEIVGLLIRCGASLSMQDVREENAFHYAARSGARMVKCLVKNSTLSKEVIQHLVSVTNIKLKFPEDVAANALTKEILIDLRVKGFHPQSSRTKEKVKKKE
jgi:ankyrin repeat protein